MKPFFLLRQSPPARPLRPITLCVLLLGLSITTATAQLAYQGPAGAVVFAKAQQLEAAGNKAAAAAAYQQAYEAYTSVDDSDGMTKALARKNALGARPATAGARPRPAATVAPRPAVPRPAGPTAAAPPVPGSMPQAGRMVGNKPVGLFFVTKSVLGNFRTMSYYFSPDGLAYEDPLGLTTAELAATPARSKGRYSVTGKTLSIAWNGYPKPEAAEMNMLGGGFSWSGGSIFSTVGPFRSMSQLVGTFEGGSTTYATAMGQSAVSKSLTFNADGTYQGSGVATVTTVSERSVAETGGTSSQAGHWHLDGWLLTLTDAQGHTTRDIAYPVGDGKGKAMLFNFNGTAYSRH